MCGAVCGVCRQPQVSPAHRSIPALFLILPAITCSSPVPPAALMFFVIGIGAFFMLFAQQVGSTGTRCTCLLGAG